MKCVEKSACTSARLPGGSGRCRRSYLSSVQNTDRENKLDKDCHSQRLEKDVKRAHRNPALDVEIYYYIVTILSAICASLGDNIARTHEIHRSNCRSSVFFVIYRNRRSEGLGDMRSKHNERYFLCFCGNYKTYRYFSTRSLQMCQMAFFKNRQKRGLRSLLQSHKHSNASLEKSCYWYSRLYHRTSFARI